MEVVARVLQLVGTSCLLGTLVISRGAGGCSDSPPPPARRLWRATVVLGPSVITAGLVLEALRTSAALTQGGAWSVETAAGIGSLVRSTSYGRVLLVRWVAGLAAAAALGRWVAGPATAAGPAAAAPARSPSRSSYAAWTRAALAAGVLALGMGAGGHAQSSAVPLLTLPAQGLHTALATAWFGGLAQLAVLSLAGGHGPWLAQRVGRFSRFGLYAMVAVAATGTLISLTRVFSAYDLVETDYGMRLAAKLAWVGGVLALAALNRFAVVPRLARRPDGPAPSALRLGLWAEAVVALGVMALAGGLATTPPPLGPAERYVVYLDGGSPDPPELTLKAGRAARVVIVSPNGRRAVEFIPPRPGRYPLLCTECRPYAAGGIAGWVTVVE